MLERAIKVFRHELENTLHQHIDGEPHLLIVELFQGDPDFTLLNYVSLEVYQTTKYFIDYIYLFAQ